MDRNPIHPEHANGGWVANCVKTLNGERERERGSGACSSDEISPLSRRINMFATWFYV